LRVSWCAGDRCDMTGSDEDHGGSRRPGAEDRGWSSTGRVLGDWTIEGSGDAVYAPYREQGDEEHEILGLVSKPRLTVCQWFDLKITGASFLIWASKPTTTVW
jgi:hypothetical protein